SLSQPSLRLRLPGPEGEPLPYLAPPTLAPAPPARPWNRKEARHVDEPAQAHLDPRHGDGGAAARTGLPAPKALVRCCPERALLALLRGARGAVPGRRLPAAAPRLPGRGVREQQRRRSPVRLG